MLILDEVEFIAQDRASASSGVVQLVTTTTNQLLLEIDRHTLPINLCSNVGERIDAALKRRCDLVFEVKPIASELETLRLLLDLDAPHRFKEFGGQQGDLRLCRRQAGLTTSGGGGTQAALAAGVAPATCGPAATVELGGASASEVSARENMDDLHRAKAWEDDERN